MKIIKSRLFKALVLLFLFGVILGIISYFVLDKNNYIIDYYNYSTLNRLLKSILYNYKYSFIIWISGIILLSIFIIPFIIIFRGISTSFTIISIISLYKVKGLIISLILLFPCIIINELVYLLLSYYSFSFSFKTYNVIKHNKNINLKSYIRNYLYIFISSLIILLISSLFDTYISSNLIKIVL